MVNKCNSCGTKSYKYIEGPPGPQGARGAQGFMGIEGMMGLDGVTGPEGIANTWFVGSGCETPTGAHRDPINGDYLLNLENCDICQYQEGGWTSTNQVLNCVRCEDVYQCIQDIPNPTGEQDNMCTVTLTLPDSSPVFNSGFLSITELIVGDQVQVPAVGFFSDPISLSTLLSPDWQYINLSGVNVYIAQFQLLGNLESTQTFITFDNGISVDLNLQCKTDCPDCNDFQGVSEVLVRRNSTLNWIDSCCLGLTGMQGSTGVTGMIGLQGVTGAQGEIGSTGPTGIVACEDIVNCLDQVEVDSMDCQYCGLYDPSCVDFLDPVVGTYSVMTALDDPLGVVGGPVDFTDSTSLAVALAGLNIVIGENQIKVTDSVGDINRVFFFNSGAGGGNILASFELFREDCCPTEVNSQTEVMTRLTGGNLGWVSANCLLKPNIDIKEEICSGVQICREVKSSISFNVGEPFLNNNGIIFATPWTISQFIILGVDQTVSYSATTFNNFQELGDILVGAGWEQVGSSSMVYNFCFFSDTIPVDITTSLSIIDNAGQIFYCKEFQPDIVTQGSQDLDDMSVMIKTMDLGLVFGSPTKIFDAIPDAPGTTYTCKTCITTDTFFNDLTAPGPWEITDLIISGQTQTIVSTQFSTLIQFQALLTNLGWTDSGSNVWTIQTVLTSPNTTSSITIMNTTPTSETVVLQVSCSSTTDTTDSLFLSKDQSGELYWASPSSIPTNTCCPDVSSSSSGIMLEDVPDCGIIPMYDLEINLDQNTIDLINSHFCSTGPYWIYDYGLSDGSEILNQENITQPFGLTTLSDAFVSLGWTSTSNEDGTITLRLAGSTNYISGISINLMGNSGATSPFNYVIPISNVTDVNCPGITTDAKIMIRDGTDHCFVDLECIVPPAQPAIDVEDEISNIGDCPAGISYRVCINLDQCDVDRMIATLGSTQQLQISRYLLVGGTSVELDPVEILGVSPTLEQVITGFTNQGWASPDILARPVELFLITGNNVNYVGVERSGSNQNLPPYPFLLGTSCSTVSDCPSQDPANKLLVKLPDDSLCWTPVCTTTDPPIPLIQCERLQSTVDVLFTKTDSITMSTEIFPDTIIPVSGIFSRINERVELNLVVPYSLPEQSTDLFTVESTISFTSPSPLPTAWSLVDPVIQFTIHEEAGAGEITKDSTFSNVVFSSISGNLGYVLKCVNGVANSDFRVNITITYKEGEIVA